MKALLRFALLAPLAAAACGPGGPSDAGTDADSGPPRNDRINVNCTSAAGEEGAVACNARLASRQMGARFFIGQRTACYDDPNNPACVPLCELSVMNPENCSFTAEQTGCPYIQRDGYTVVVEAGGRRWRAGVGAGDTCASTMMGRREWARVGFEDLEGAAICARSIPEGGYGAPRYGSCPTPDAPCGDPSAMPADTCREIMIGGMNPYTANMCTHACNSSADCGSRGVCVENLCFDRAGTCVNLQCQAGFQQNPLMGGSDLFCLPMPAM